MAKPSIMIVYRPLNGEKGSIIYQNYISLNINELYVEVIRLGDRDYCRRYWFNEINTPLDSDEYANVRNFVFYQMILGENARKEFDNSQPVAAFYDGLFSQVKK